MTGLRLYIMAAGIMFFSCAGGLVSYGQQTTIKDLIAPMLDVTDFAGTLSQLDNYGEPPIANQQELEASVKAGTQNAETRINKQTPEHTIKYLRKHHLKMVLGTWKRLLYDENYDQLVRDAIILQNHSHDVKVIPQEIHAGELNAAYTYATQFQYYSEQFLNVLLQIQARRATYPREATTLRGLAAENFGSIVKLCISCHSLYNKMLPAPTLTPENKQGSASPPP